MRSLTLRLSRVALVACVAIALIVGFVAPGRWSSAQEPNALVGDYAVTIAKKDVPEDLASGAVLVGRWHLAFQADGSYYAERLDIGRVVTGTWEVDGDTLTVTDESGLVSCSNAASSTGDQGDISTGTYSVTLDESFLALTTAEDGCRSRSILFGTRDFGQFVACLTNAPSGDATPIAEASPISDELSTGRGESNDGGLFDRLTPTTNDSGSSNDQAQSGGAKVDGEIDDLLAQMTACWQTQDADQFLPLLTDGFGQAFLGAGSVEEQKDALEELMIQPLVWERAGDIVLNGDKASVVVRLSIAGSDQFLKYRFAFVDDVWLWDGQEA